MNCPLSELCPLVNVSLVYYVAGLVMVVLLAFMTGCSTRQVGKPQDGLADELIRMARQDQELRRRMVDHLRDNPSAEFPRDLQSRIVQVDAENLARLKQIVNQHGWPTVSVVGREAAEAAWLLAQHADRDPAFQAHVLQLMKPLVRGGEVSARNFALLADRVSAAQGEPQLYGTQYTRIVIDGQVHFGPSTPIADPERLAQRRSALGLPSHAEYVRALREMLRVPDDARPLPPERAAR